MKGVHLSCRSAREALQDLHDHGLDSAAAAPDLRAHLEGCAGCREFARFLGGFPAALREALEREMRLGPAPERGAASRRAPDRAALRWGLLAASLVAAAGLSLGAARTLGGYQAARTVRGEVSRLVEDLYAEPLLADAEPAPRRAELSDYLQQGGSDVLDWLEGGTPLSD